MFARYNLLSSVTLILAFNEMKLRLVRHSHTHHFAVSRLRQSPLPGPWSQTLKKMSGRSSSSAAMGSSTGNTTRYEEPPKRLCRHLEEAHLLTSKTDKNPFRRYYRCAQRYRRKAHLTKTCRKIGIDVEEDRRDAGVKDVEVDGLR
ncbi:zinc ion binding [Striga asiatica]|uniref:Zinc ion binding n=1 Tax=Striga asiatica TaxID=4170 RepID=A0A5A7PQR3_STRAF|nr:zinc ion binding [Striga asiatica]